MAKDLRHFLETARKAGPEYYIEAKKPLEPDLEVNVLQEKLAAQGHYPVLFCPQMKGSKLPLCSNLFGSYEMLGLALDIDLERLKKAGRAEIQQEYMRRLKITRDIEWVRADEAPVKDVIITGEDVDLALLPIPKGSVGDSGKYIGIGGLICSDADTGALNMGIYRHEVQGRNKLGCWITPTHHGSYFARRYGELGRNMEVALYLGHHPAVSFAGTATPQLGDDELQLAGGFLGEPLRVVKGHTVDLPVPADAEIVIEGVIDPNNWVTDGPYAEYAGYYGSRRPCYQIEVTAITMRKDAIFHHIDSAHREHNLCMQLSRETVVYQAVKRRIPTLKGVYTPPSSRGYHNYISIAKRAQGEGMLAGMLALGADSRAKCAIVVDEDVDPFNEEAVWWAVATKVSWDKNVAVLPRLPMESVDPRCYAERGLDYESGDVATGEIMGKVIIDATLPVTVPYATRIIPPKEIWDRMELRDYLK